MAVEIALLKAARPDLDPVDRGAAAAGRAARARHGRRSGRGSCRAGDPPPPAEPSCPRGGPPSAPPAAERRRVTIRSSRRRAADGRRAPGPADRRRGRAAGPSGARPRAGPAAPGASSLEEIQRVWPAVLDKLRGDGAGAGGDLRGRAAGRARRGGAEDRVPGRAPPSTNARRRRRSKREQMAEAFDGGDRRSGCGRTTCCSTARRRRTSRRRARGASTTRRWWRS